jgi:hypothetical protein
MNRTESSCVICPSGFYCPSGSSQPKECPSGTHANSDGSQCAVVSGLPSSSLTVTVIIVGVTIIDFVHACIFVRCKKLRAANSKCWILTFLILGPLAWFFWWYKHRFVAASQTFPSQVHPLLSDYTSSFEWPHMESSVAVQALPRVTTREIKINRHVKEKRGGSGTVFQATWKGSVYAIKKPHFSGAMTNRDEAKFLMELENQSRLRHPNCVGLYGTQASAQNIVTVFTKSSPSHNM